MPCGCSSYLVSCIWWMRSEMRVAAVVQLTPFTPQRGFCGGFCRLLLLPCCMLLRGCCCCCRWFCCCWWDVAAVALTGRKPQLRPASQPVVSGPRTFWCHCTSLFVCQKQQMQLHWANELSIHALWLKKGSIPYSFLVLLKHILLIWDSIFWLCVLPL